MHRDVCRVSAGSGLSVSSYRGFSLIELMVVLAILSILLLVAVPGYGTWVSSSRIETATNKLRSMMSLARSEAVRRGERIAVCSTLDQYTCSGTSRSGKKIWQRALLFQDDDLDRVFDEGETRIRVIDLTEGIMVIWNRGESTAFKGDGSLLGGANGSFYVVDPADLGGGSRLVAQNTGRVRQASITLEEVESLQKYLDNR